MSVTLITNDGHLVHVSTNVAEKFQTIKNLFQDADPEDDIPLSDVNEKCLIKVLEYAVYDTEHNPDSEEPNEWENKYCEMDQVTLFEVILAANYLHYQRLLDLTCKKVAQMIRGKTPDEIREIFGIENDLNEQEKEQIKLENNWIE